MAVRFIIELTKMLISSGVTFVIGKSISFVKPLIKNVMLAEFKKRWLKIVVNSCVYSECVLTIDLTITAFLVNFNFIIKIDINHHPVKVNIKLK
jgi:riboflavin transporter FmnP